MGEAAEALDHGPVPPSIVDGALRLRMRGVVAQPFEQRDRQVLVGQRLAMFEGQIQEDALGRCQGCLLYTSDAADE